MKKTLIIILLVLYGYNSAWSQCQSTVTISGVYSVASTGSNTWIATSGVTTIPTGANVTLDANPATNGYVLLDAGFETQPNATFLAIVQTPCALLGLDDKNLKNDIKVYPNPTSNNLIVESSETIISTEIFDSNGKTILATSQNNTDVKLNIENIPIGIYFLKINTTGGSSMAKIVKK